MVIRFRSTARSGGLLAVLALTISLAAGTPLHASEPEEGELDTAGETGELFPVAELPFAGDTKTNGSTRQENRGHAWVWPEGRRLYMMGRRSTSGSLAGGGYQRIMAYDLDSLEQQRVEALPRRVVADLFTGGSNSMVVDRAGGRLILATMRHPLNAATQAVPETTASPTTACGGAVGAGCVEGVMVLDAESLELLGHAPLGGLSADAPLVRPVLQSMEYVPSQAPAESGKLLMVVEEMPGYDNDNHSLYPRTRGGALVYVIQFDLDRMQRDWIVRAEGCRGSRESTRTGETSSELRFPHWSAVYKRPGHPEVVVGCNSSGQMGVVVKIPLGPDGRPAGAVPVVVDDGDPLAGSDGEQEPQPPVAAAERQTTINGPPEIWEFIADPEHDRMLMRSLSAGSEVWWAFDAREGSFVGTIGIGPESVLADPVNGFDRDTGRLYVVSGGGTFLTDTRRVPLPQARVFPQFGTQGKGPIVVDPGDEERPTRFFVRGENAYRVFEDHIPLPPPSDVAVGDEDGGQAEVRSLDLDEAEGVTDATFDGAARGFGVRAILMGGAEAFLRAGPFDPGTLTVLQARLANLSQTMLPLADRLAPYEDRLGPDPCKDADREVIFAMTGVGTPATMDVSSSTGNAEPVILDASTRRDMDQPVSRCANASWDEVWAAALFSQSPEEEPSLPWLFGDGQAACVSSDEDPSGSFRDRIVGGFEAQVECGSDEVSGWSRAGGVRLEGVAVAEAWSSFRIYRDAERGIVTRAESVARGIDIGGVVHIDSVRSVAESWANGRRNQGVDPALERELDLVGSSSDEQAEGQPGEAGSSEPVIDETNCDFTRTAGTCFQRAIFGVRTPVYSCGPCGDERALIDGLNRALAPMSASAQLRDPEPSLVAGADDGYIAGILRPEKDRLADLVLNADLIPTTLPGLEIVRNASPARPVNNVGVVPPAPARGRQIYQFAGVEVSSTYSVQCLLEYDPETNVCAPVAEELASLTVELRDVDGEPLAGGAFELRADSDGDGVLGLADELVPEGACVTGPDGAGTCSFEGLEPGPYLVTQLSAPPGYAATEEPFAVELLSGDQRTVTFTNGPSASVIDIEVTDESGAPLAGASFGVFPAEGGEAVATCTTDENGACRLEVEPGAYVLRQTGVPDGFQGIGDIPFEITSAGQTATVGLVLAAAGAELEVVPEPPPPPPAPGPIAFDPGPSFMPVTTDFVPPLAGETSPMDVPGPSIAEQVGQTIVRVVQAPAAAVRLFTRSPVEAASFAGVWLLLALAFLAVRKRMELVRLLN